MGKYDDWKQPQLQAEASKRDLSAGGSNAEIIARLEEWDAAHPDEDLLDNPPDDSPLQDEDTAKEAPKPPAKSYETSFSCPGELSTGMHNEYREQAYARALAEGLSPRGGMAGVSRTGFKDIDGRRHAVYSVVLART